MIIMGATITFVADLTLKQHATSDFTSLSEIANVVCFYWNKHTVDIDSGCEWPRRHTTGFSISVIERDRNLQG
jgi:hypothetical protein